MGDITWAFFTTRGFHAGRPPQSLTETLALIYDAIGPAGAPDSADTSLQGQAARCWHGMEQALRAAALSDPDDPALERAYDHTVSRIEVVLRWLVVLAERMPKPDAKVAALGPLLEVVGKALAGQDALLLEVKRRRNNAAHGDRQLTMTARITGIEDALALVVLYVYADRQILRNNLVESYLPVERQRTLMRRMCATVQPVIDELPLRLRIAGTDTPTGGAIQAHLASFGRDLVIVGDAGGGKTWLTERFLEAVAADDGTNRRLAGTIALGRAPLPQSWDEVWERLFPAATASVPWSKLDAGRRALIILDGWDELHVLQQEAWLRLLALPPKQRPRVVVTTRPGPLPERHLANLPGWQRWIIVPLDREQIESLAEQHPDSLLAQMVEGPGLQPATAGLLDKPFFVRVLLAMPTQADIPQSPAMLVELLLRQSLIREEAVVGCEDPLLGRVSPWSPEQARRICARLALADHCSCGRGLWYRTAADTVASELGTRDPAVRNGFLQRFGGGMPFRWLPGYDGEPQLAWFHAAIYEHLLGDAVLAQPSAAVVVASHAHARGIFHNVLQRSQDSATVAAILTQDSEMVAWYASPESVELIAREWNGLPSAGVWAALCQAGPAEAPEQVRGWAQAEHNLRDDLGWRGLIDLPAPAAWLEHPRLGARKREAWVAAVCHAPVLVLLAEPHDLAGRLLRRWWRESSDLPAWMHLLLEIFEKRAGWVAALAQFLGEAAHIPERVWLRIIRGGLEEATTPMEPLPTGLLQRLRSSLPEEPADRFDRFLLNVFAAPEEVMLQLDLGPSSWKEYIHRVPWCAALRTKMHIDTNKTVDTYFVRAVLFQPEWAMRWFNASPADCAWNDIADTLLNQDLLNEDNLMLYAQDRARDPDLIPPLPWSRLRHLIRRKICNRVLAILPPIDQDRIEDHLLDEDATDLLLGVSQWANSRPRFLDRIVGAEGQLAKLIRDSPFLRDPRLMPVNEDEEPVWTERNEESLSLAEEAEEIDAARQAFCAGEDDDSSPDSLATPDIDSVADNEDSPDVR